MGHRVTLATRSRQRRLAVLLLTAVVAIAGTRAATGRSGRAVDAARSNAQAFLERLLRETGTPGISGAVASKGRIVFSAGVGYIDLENTVPATGSSVYNIGSVSKAVTGIAVMQLVERGRVRLDDDIRTYVPELRDFGETIRLRHLLTHTSGIRHYHATDFPGTPDNENIAPVASYLDGLKFFARDPLLFPPGKYRFYTSYGVNLLQGVVEKASGSSFEAYLRERIWAPAGMASADLDIPERIVPHRARSYRLENGKVFNYYYNDLRYKFASGAMIASVEDLVRLGVAVNRNGLLKPETRAAMYRPQTEGLLDFDENGPPKPQRRGQGLLWDLRQDAEGRAVAYHCGSVKGSNACLVNFYEEDLVAAVATNSWECCGWSRADALAAFFRSPLPAE